MQGKLKGDDADIMALQFFSPIYLLMTVCDRQPEREKECLQKPEKHIRQFKDCTKAFPKKRIKAGIKTKAMFSLMRMMQKADLGSGEADRLYWEKSGWLGKERPWRSISS